MYIISRIKTQIIYCTLSIGVLFISCNKDFENKLNFDQDYQGNNISETQYKVAYIVVEGAVGTIVAKEATDFGLMPNLGNLSLNSITSWNAVSAGNKDDLTSYADLLTGVEFPKHAVVSTNNNNNLVNYPTLFSRLSDLNGLSTALITSNANLSQLVPSSQVDVSKQVTTDAEVTSSTIEEVGKESASIVMATFKNVREVGESSGYDSEAYKTALGTFDSQLKSIVDVIHARKNYKNEKWLIIVASTKGGQYTLGTGLDDGSVFSDTERNNFVIINNDKFAYKLTERMQTVDPAWVSSAVSYSGSGSSAKLSASQSNAFNFGNNISGGEYTISLKLKVVGKPASTSTTANGVFIGKQENAANSSAGWSFMYNGHNGWRFTAAGTHAIDNQKLELDTWYSLTAKIYTEGTVRRVKVFRDGVLKGNSTITSINLNSPNIPLQFGYKSGSWGSNAGYKHLVADVRIYNVALPDDFIAANSCSTLVFPYSPYFGNLMGYWPGNDKGAELRDQSGNRRHMVLENESGTTNPYAWVSFAERAASICPTIPDNPEYYVLRSVDVPRLIYNWLNLRGIDQYDLDSQIWNPNFINN